jgi:hypothetical protein
MKTQRISIPISVGPIQLDRHGYTPHPDPRYARLIAAGFIATSVKYLAEGETSMATFFNAVGPEGHIYRSSPSPLPYYDKTKERQIFPSYYDLKIFGRWQGRPVFQVTSGGPSRVAACAVQTHQGIEVAVINQTPRLQEVRLRGFAPSPGGTKVSLLDETTFWHLRIAHDGRLAEVSEVEVGTPGEEPSLTLRPYAVAIIKNSH